MTPAALGATIEGYVSIAMRQNTAARAMGHYLGRPGLRMDTMGEHVLDQERFWHRGREYTLGD
jgi:hypothetical protein